MKKKKTHVGKEVGILIALTILILLIAAVAFYDYIPSNINIPETIEYASDSTTTSIKQEIAYTNGGDTTADESFSDEELVTSLKSYSIEAADLTVYGQKNLYNSGNSNPFDYAEEAAPQTEGTTTNSTTNDSANTNSTTTNEGTSQTQPSTSTTTTTAGTGTTGTFFESSTSK